jgi:hypothetical protein
MATQQETPENIRKDTPPESDPTILLVAQFDAAQQARQSIPVLRTSDFHAKA